MSTLHTRGYKEARNWADDFETHINQIGADIMFKNNLMGVVFQKPTLNEDRRQGIDMIVVTETIKMSYRVRKASALRYWEKGFTIRTSSKGYPSELNKIMSPDFADYLVYGLASPDKFGIVDAAVMLDLKSIGAQLINDPSIIQNAIKQDDFIDLAYNQFHYPVIVGTYGIDNQGEIPCQ